MKTFTVLLIVANMIVTSIQVEAIDATEAYEIADDIFGMNSNIKLIEI